MSADIHADVVCLGESMVTKEYVSRIRGISVATAVAEDVNPPGTTTVLPGDFELIATLPEGEGQGYVLDARPVSALV